MKFLINAAGIILSSVLLLGCDSSKTPATAANADTKLQQAENLIDAFYSFDPAALNALLGTAPESVASIIFYQGWAEGGNYKIVERKACINEGADSVSCAITVEDDPMLALGIDFKVTDTFTITFIEGEISAVETSSNDMQVYYDASAWVREKMPELIEQPCQGFFNGGPTPGDCARAMTEGYALFAASEDFPDL